MAKAGKFPSPQRYDNESRPILSFIKKGGETKVKN